MAGIRIARDGPIRTITLARPEKRNALNSEMIDALTDAFSEPPKSGDRVLVLRAEGTSFCSGIDLKERAKKPAYKGESPMGRILHAMEANPLPIVAVVEGDAIAGGNELALHCDFVVASTGARFGMSLAQLGFAPTWFLAKKLMEVMGPIGAREMLMLGDPMPAARIYELGAITRVAEPSDVEMAAQQIIERLAANAPMAVKTIKALTVRLMQFREDIDHSDIDAMVEATRSSQDAKIGIAARIEKRTPEFTGE